MAMVIVAVVIVVPLVLINARVAVAMVVAAEQAGISPVPAVAPDERRSAACHDQNGGGKTHDLLRRGEQRQPEAKTEGGHEDTVARSVIGIRERPTLTIRQNFRVTPALRGANPDPELHNGGVR